MSQDIDYYTKELKDTRLLKTNPEIDRFERAMDFIYSKNNIAYLPNLCQGFDDKTQHEEVTWSLIHAVEAYYSEKPKEYNSLFIRIIDENILLPHAQGWLELLIMRTLNEDDALDTFKTALLHANQHVKKTVKEIITKLMTEDPDQFRDSAIQLLNSLN